MKKLTAVLAAAGLICATSGIALASDTATQMVTYQVEAINELSVSGNPEALIINAAVAGAAPTSVNNDATTYAITTNETGRKITGAIGTAMPAGVTLTANLTAPTGGSSTGAVTLTTVAQDLVTGISTLNESGKGITFDLSATSAAGVVASANTTLTLTIIAPVI
jgi:hypothetical protein